MTIYSEYEKAYRHYSAKYGPDTAIFYLVGKFYELYDSAADPKTPIQRISDILEVKLSLKKGDYPGGTDGLFAGVPEQSLHKYAGILTRAGWAVVVFDQVKDAKGDVSHREAKRILTPGTHVEDAKGNPQAVSIAGIWLEEAAWGTRQAPKFGLVSLDLTTGAVTTYEGAAIGKDDSWVADDAFHFFQVHAPREAIVWWRGAAVAEPAVETIRRQFGLLAAQRIQILPATANAQGTLEIPLVREDLLRRAFSIKTLLPVRSAIGFSGENAERALCALLNWTEQMYPSGPKQLHVPESWSPTTNLFLGNHALTQLNMVCPRLEDSVLGLFSKTRTPMGQRAMRLRILHPIADERRLNRCYTEIEAIGSLSDTDRAILERALGQIADLPRLHRRVTTAEVTPADVLLLDQSYGAARTILRILDGTPLSAPESYNHETLFKEFLAIFDPDRAMAASDDAFCFRAGLDEETDLQEKTIQETYKAIDLAKDAVANWAGLPMDPNPLRLEFRETLGPVLTATKTTMKILTDRLATKSPPFPGIRVQSKKTSPGLEIPHLDTLYRAILNTRVELAAAVRRALPGLCDRLTAAALPLWDTLESWLSRVDVTFTLWRVSDQLGFVRPFLSSGASASIQIEGLRHPLIEATAIRTEYVRHSVTLDAASSGWLVYGMNASGKSSLMKAVGICVLLAQAGCFVPAARCVLTPFRALYTRILNTDNLWSGLSSFAVEMTELQEILNRADSYSLVLGDELCSGTESVSATALVGGSLVKLHDRGARFIFATHLHGLMERPRIRDLPKLKVWHLKVRYDPAADRLVYERTLTPGAGSSLYGLEVARAMNIPEDVLAMAHEFRREILGTAAANEAPLSDWNRAVARRACELCGNPIVRDLEVHHIQPRASANHQGRLEDGTHQNHVRNLIVVCAKCHDKHHSGEITIGPLVATSDGPQRVQANSPQPTEKRSTKWTKEQLATIEAYLRNYPNVVPKRLVYDLETKEGIQLSVSSLTRMRTNLKAER